MRSLRLSCVEREDKGEEEASSHVFFELGSAAFLIHRRIGDLRASCNESKDNESEDNESDRILL